MVGNENQREKQNEDSSAPHNPVTELFLNQLYILLDHRWQTQGPRPNPTLHLVLSGLAPCFYPAAVPSSLPLVKE